METVIRFWHWLTTSRYTRHLEQENAELRAELASFKRMLLPRLAQDSVPARPVTAGELVAQKALRLRHNGWSVAKQRLEAAADADRKTEARMERAYEAHKEIV